MVIVDGRTSMARNRREKIHHFAKGRTVIVLRTKGLFVISVFFCEWILLFLICLCRHLCRQYVNLLWFIAFLSFLCPFRLHFFFFLLLTHFVCVIFIPRHYTFHSKNEITIGYCNLLVVAECREKNASTMKMQTERNTKAKKYRNKTVHDIISLLKS